jgi:hypothetical protein
MSEELVDGSRPTQVNGSGNELWLSVEVARLRMVVEAADEVRRVADYGTYDEVHNAISTYDSARKLLDIPH